MSGLQTALAVFGGLVVIAGVAASLYAWSKGTAQEARITRLQGERDDYLSRLNFIEPRLDAAERQNEVLRTLLDPTPKLQQIGEAIDEKAGEILGALDRQNRNTDAMKGVLLSQARTLDEIRVRLHPEKD